MGNDLFEGNCRFLKLNLENEAMIIFGFIILIEIQERHKVKYFLSVVRHALWSAFSFLNQKIPL